MLILFDIDGTLCQSFLREGAPKTSFDLVEPLPHRIESIELLVRTWGNRMRMALVTNQGGVALGYQHHRQVARKIKRVQLALGLPGGLIRIRPNHVMDYRSRIIPSEKDPRVAAYVSFGLASSRARADLRVAPDDPWRKPGSGMLEAAMRDHDTIPDQTVYVGDMDSDKAAADAAGVHYHDAAEFFNPLV